MNQSRFIKNKQQYQTVAAKFFETIFQEALNKKCGDIEIWGFKEKGPQVQRYFNSIAEAVNIAHDLCEAQMDVYVGVNPRIGNAANKENVHWLTAFHAEIDYGEDGHKKESEYKTYDEALIAIESFEMKPTCINHSGGGFHCYWVLNEPVKVSDMGFISLENVNRNLIAALCGDLGTQNINRILRVPGTYNLKLPSNPREVTVIVDDGPMYDFEVFKSMLVFEKKGRTTDEPEAKKRGTQKDPVQKWDNKISSLPVTDKIKYLIIGGNNGSYLSRSEADQAVITALVNKGVSEFDIKTIFQNYRIGEKYREHSSPDEYLKHNIEKAKEFSNLTEEERQDPLFISGSLYKDKNDRYQLRIVPFQEYMNKKHKLRYLEKEKAFFRYNDKCYEQCYEERLNYLCQNELGKHRDLFSKSAMSNFMHYSIADDLVDAEKAYLDQVRYLTMQNGLYDLIEHKLAEHTSDIFTTNLLPYEYDPGAQCPRWIQYLNEVFLSDSDKIKVVQEAVGYSFHKDIPKPALFFLHGPGSNGKSVFIDTLSYLCGKENVSNISLNLLSSEIYILDLFGKMVNVSSETPNKKFINTDLVKAVVGGDWVTGRELYKRPSKFKPFAKHFLAMNQLPIIEDNTHGMWRRIQPIEFPKRFTENEMDVDLTAKLCNELSGIFNWALEGYKRLRLQKFIFSKSKSMQKNKQQYQTQSNSVLDFILNFFEESELEDSIAFKDAHDCYKAFCEKEDHKKPYPKRQFRTFMEDQGFIIENSSKHSNQLRIFGAKYVSDKKQI